MVLGGSSSRPFARTGMKMRLVDLTGKVFGRLTAMRRSGTSDGCAVWECHCHCGRVLHVGSRSLASGRTKSCGCLQREKASFVGKNNALHGKSKTKEHRTWAGIKTRCTNKNCKYYHRYGGRGIKMCDRWEQSFEAFLADVGPAPSLLHSIDRFPDNDGNYEPGNCRWVLCAEQQRNRSTNKIIEFQGRRLCVVEWSELTGINSQTIYRRLKMGWSVDRALTKPVQRKRKKGVLHACA